MANKQISQLPAASVMNDGDLLVCEQNGVAKRLTGSILMAMINSHGGITGSSYTPPVAPSLQGTLTLTFTDGTSTEVPIMNGAQGATGATGAQGEKGDPFTFSDFTPEQLESLRGEQGAQGVPGNPGYCHIKWSAVEPTSNADMGDLPDEWMGIYSGSSATAPTDYTAYVWYKIKGAQGYRGATGAPGANGTKIYLSNAAPILYDGYYYFDSGFLVSPDRQIGVSPARGDLVLYRNSLYSATGLTDIVRGERCVFGYNIVLNTATDEQVQDAVDEYLSNHQTVTGTFTNEAKNALLTLLEKVAYTVSDGQTYLETLRTELFRINVDSISAVFTQGSAVIYNTDPLDTLKQYLVVTATYSDSTTEVLSDSVYTLSGTLTVGTSTITVTYGGKTATFDVIVSDMMVNDMLTLDGIQNTRSGHDASATAWEDLSGNRHDFAAQSGATLLWGADHAAFDAANRVMKCVADLQGSGNALTIEIIGVNDGDSSWATGSTHQGMVLGNVASYADTNGQFKFYSYRSSSDNGLSARYGSTSLGYTGIRSVKYVAYVFDSTSMTRYVNGVANSPVTVAYQSGTKSQNWVIGGVNATTSTAGNGAYFNGKIFRIGISASAMTAEEIASRYAFFAERFGIV